MFGNGAPQFGGYGQPMAYGQPQYQQMTQQPQPFQPQQSIPQMQYQQPMQYQAPPEPVQQMPPAMPVTLQNVVDMMGQMLQELAAIREAMRRE